MLWHYQKMTFVFYVDFLVVLNVWIGLPPYNLKIETSKDFEYSLDIFENSS